MKHIISGIAALVILISCTNNDRSGAREGDSTTKSDTIKTLPDTANHPGGVARDTTPAGRP